ncbi:MAG: hypothetical protein EOO03_02010 [Chitinophagaceae bacterium]|nr:MAG: hypothetical protein EOO03_02010 [Chitinophagaceae bacterium]
MRTHRFSFFLIALFLFFNTQAQVTKVPPTAKENFAAQYPGATQVEWYNEILDVNVTFELDGKKMNAYYNNKGIWKQTLQDVAYDSLPAPVRDGFNKSKYVERSVTEAKIVYFPGNIIQYRIKAEKNDWEKKYLFFNEKGRLLRENITL